MSTEAVSGINPSATPARKLLDIDLEAEDARPLPLQEALEQRKRQDSKLQKKRSQWVMTISLLPFAFTGLVNPSAWIGYVVIVNEVLCHAGAALDWRFASQACFFGTVCNVALCIYVNWMTHWQPWTALLTGASALVYLANGHYKKVKYTVVHVFFVQWMLSFLLFVFESSKKS